ncbi:MAG: DUF2165 family protein [Pseudomonadota bacterium]
MDIMTLVAQTCLLAYLAAWLTLGARDNIFHPSINGIFTEQVLELKRLEELVPEDYEMLKHRRVLSKRMQGLLYRAIVMVEMIVSLVLWVGVVWMAFAVFGGADVGTAKSIAIAGALGFTTIWSGMLIAGNHFAYWYCHEWAQNTHFQLMYLGIGAMIFLAVA